VSAKTVLAELVDPLQTAVRRNPHHERAERSAGMAAMIVRL
jgi:hypothetical protein